MQIRYSRQRELIREILMSTKSHPTAEWIYEKAREQDPTLSLGTVYRNLKFLCEQGEAIALETADKCIHFDGNINNHRHFICNECGRVYDLSESEVEKPCELTNAGFTVERESCVYYGVCAKCNQN